MSIASQSPSNNNKFKYGRKRTFNNPEINNRQFNDLCHEATNRVAKNHIIEQVEFQKVFTMTNNTKNK